MNKLELVAVFVSIIIVFSVVCGDLFYQKQIAEQEVEHMEEELERMEEELDLMGKELERVEKIASPFQTNITALTSSGPNPYVGLTMYSKVNVTIQNFGTHDVRGLILSVRHASVSRSEAKTEYIRLLKAGEAQNFTFEILYGINVMGQGFIATLKAENVILDEYLYPPAK